MGYFAMMKMTGTVGSRKTHSGKEGSPMKRTTVKRWLALVSVLLLFVSSLQMSVLAAGTKISISRKPTKMVYTVGEKFNSSGMKLKVTKSGGKTTVVSSGFTCTPTRLTKAGTQKIKVKYKGSSTTLAVTVNKKIKSLAVSKKPTKLTYNVNDTLATAGMKLKITYTDKSTKTITKGFTCTPTRLTKAGTQKITVKYSGKTAAFNVTVKGKQTPLSALTTRNAGTVLKKQLYWYIGCVNQLAGNLSESDSFYSGDTCYSRSMDYNSKAAFVRALKQNIVITDGQIASLFTLKEKNGKLYIGTQPQGAAALDMKSVSLRKTDSSGYYIAVDSYAEDGYNSTYILKVVVKDGCYKINIRAEDCLVKSNPPSETPWDSLEFGFVKK